jgi:hypothetical protein
MKKERWIQVRDYEGHYEVSSHGRVRSVDRIITNINGIKSRLSGKVLRPNKNYRGYLYLVFSKNGITKCVGKMFSKS